MTAAEEREAWLRFAEAALGAVMSLPMSHDDVHRLSVHGAAAYQKYRAQGAAEWADAMLDEWRKRFDPEVQP